LKPFLVPRELYANSATWYSSFWQIGAIAGPGVAGFLYSGLGFDNTLLVIIGMLVICFVLITMVSRRPVPVSDAPVLGFRESLKEGFQFVFNTPIVLYAISLDLFSVLFGGVVAILPVFAEDILKVGAEGLGVLRAAPSIGAVLTLAYMTKRPPTDHAWRNMLLAVAGFGVATIIFSQSTNFYLSVLMLALTGAFDSVSVIIRQTIMQIFPPDHLRGRVAAVNGIFVSSSNEIGAFESGLMARLLGTTQSVLVGGIFTLVALTYIYSRSKSLFSVKLN
jgi:MFS family permease